MRAIPQSYARSANSSKSECPHSLPQNEGEGTGVAPDVAQVNSYDDTRPP
jgi:hypothetical protein